MAESPRIPLERFKARVRESLAKADLHPGEAHPCPYLPDRDARDLAFRADQLPYGMFQALMDLNFRRSGKILYRPQCDTCRQCQAIRVPVAEFTPDRTQRRCMKRNRDLDVTIQTPEPTREKHELFQHYVAARHDRAMGSTWNDFIHFLYESPVLTLEIEYRLDDRLVMVGILDLEPTAASTVYSYFDPDLLKRSLGVYNVLWTVDWCRRNKLDYLYLGYYIQDCRKMNYKTNYRPCEILIDADHWERCEK
jgi:arginine-tRNA-protein transferase